MFILTAFFQTVKISAKFKPNLSIENPKLYEDVSLLISDYLFREGYKKHSHRNEKIQKEIFDYECKSLGFQNDEQKHWYSTLLKKLSDVMPDVRTLFELEMNKLDIRENFDYRNLNISLEYNMHILGCQTFDGTIHWRQNTFPKTGNASITRPKKDTTTVFLSSFVVSYSKCFFC